MERWILALGLITGGLSSSGWGCWAGMAPEHLAGKADLVVFGTLGPLGDLYQKEHDDKEQKEQEPPEKGKPHGEYLTQRDVALRGVIQVSRTLKGDKNLKYVVIGFPSLIAPMECSTDIRFTEGASGIWFLRWMPKWGIYHASYHPDAHPTSEGSFRNAMKALGLTGQFEQNLLTRPIRLDTFKAPSTKSEGQPIFITSLLQAIDILPLREAIRLRYVDFTKQWVAICKNGRSPDDVRMEEWHGREGSGPFTLYTLTAEPTLGRKHLAPYWALVLPKPRGEEVSRLALQIISKGGHHPYGIWSASASH